MLTLLAKTDEYIIIWQWPCMWMVQLWVIMERKESLSWCKILIWFMQCCQQKGMEWRLETGALWFRNSLMVGHLFIRYPPSLEWENKQTNKWVQQSSGMIKWCEQMSKRTSPVLTSRSLGVLSHRAPVSGDSGWRTHLARMHQSQHSTDWKKEGNLNKKGESMKRI